MKMSFVFRKYLFSISQSKPLKLICTQCYLDIIPSRPLYKADVLQYSNKRKEK